MDSLAIIDDVTNAVDQAIRKGRAATYDELQAIVAEQINKHVSEADRVFFLAVSGAMAAKNGNRVGCIRDLESAVQAVHVWHRRCG